jgi:hypothetical protein
MVSPLECGGHRRFLFFFFCFPVFDSFVLKTKTKERKRRQPPHSKGQRLARHTGSAYDGAVARSREFI